MSDLTDKPPRYFFYSVALGTDDKWLHVPPLKSPPNSLYRRPAPNSFINAPGLPHKSNRQSEKWKTSEARAGGRARDARTRTRTRALAYASVHACVSHVRTHVCNTHVYTRAWAREGVVHSPAQ